MICDNILDRNVTKTFCEQDGASVRFLMTSESGDPFSFESFGENFTGKFLDRLRCVQDLCKFFQVTERNPAE